MSKEFRNDNGSSLNNDQDSNMLASLEAIEEAIKRELSDIDDKESNLTQEVQKEKIWKKAICQKAKQTQKSFGKLGANIKDKKSKQPKRYLVGWY